MALQSIKAVIFEIDGVIIDLTQYEFMAWKRTADEQSIYFNQEINQKICGMDSMAGIEILLERADREYTPGEKVAICARKNDLLINYLAELTQEDTLPGTVNLLNDLRKSNIYTVIASNTNSAGIIINQLGLKAHFDLIIDSNNIRSRKPDPEALLLACERLKLSPNQCLVIESSEDGIMAGLKSGMKIAAIGKASKHPHAHIRAKSLMDIDLGLIIN